MRFVMAVKVADRVEHAPKVQQILTQYGCTIEARLGLNPGCDQEGLIILLLSGEDGVVEKLTSELSAVATVTVKSMCLD